MFVTHYTQITTLASMYPNVSNIHLKVALTYTENTSNSSNNNMISSSSSSSQSINQRSSTLSASNQQQQQQPRECIRFTHQVGSGASELKDGYGILMSELCGEQCTIEYSICVCGFSRFLTLTLQVCRQYRLQHKLILEFLMIAVNIEFLVPYVLFFHLLTHSINPFHC